ncbi:Por secretion system C-terminal sorting domain-containing protein [Mariniphaga anaerophila]|uniref:Por secretion system C-terminal sorting domain-containing protein n=1 Tax=Mariniphaga anaerophila TaxID=1484053 RepID=A0A1M4SNZ1_9BACT|nr:phosphodiester glycosidase family protein [Mariniphaga anaerophila]SHE33657.1 Por secretion system C-terminal sorting domain-containing protein [Mariniphaga anaerophila]
MKKFNLLTLLLLFGYLTASSQDSIAIQGVKYKTDTIIYRHDVGLGTMHTYFRLPDMPLTVNVLEVDVTNPYIQFETCLSYDTIKGLERPSAMASRKSKQGHVAFAAINGDFYNTVSPNKGDPINGQVLQGQMAKKTGTNPVIAFDNGKNPFIDVMSFSGTVYNGVESYPITNVNNTRNTNNMILFNSYFGQTTRTNQWGTEAVATVVGGSWRLNGKVQLKIEKINTNRGSTPIPDDKVILSGHGDAAAYLNNLNVNDIVELDMRMILKSQYQLTPQITELIGGDRIILKDGVVQENNWKELHPRTAVGFSADKSKVIMVVVDGRSIYSKGVSTKQLADIMRQSGAAFALNLDGGGSSAMVVRNEVKNTPSDGAERAVANALMVISTAIPDQATTMQLNADHITIPFGKKFQVKASTFDNKGAVVDYLNAENIQYKLTGNPGKIDTNGLFTASGTGESGSIIGTWNGLSDTISVKVIPVEEVSFSVESLVIDHRHDYTFKVFGKGITGEPYQMDNDIINFTSSDATIGTISKDGVFSGKKDGMVDIIVSTGIENQTDTCQISVEIGRGHLLLDDFSAPDSWTTSLKQIDNVTLTREVHPVYGEEMLKVDYEFKYSNRTASITLAKEIDVYGMPDSIQMEAAGSGHLSSYYYVLDHQYGVCQTSTFSDDKLLKRQVAINTAKIKQEEYPVPLVSIRLNVERDPEYVSGTSYNGTFWLKGLSAVYPEKDQQSSIPIRQKAEELTVFPNPTKDGFFIRANQIEQGLFHLYVYKTSGEEVRNEAIYINKSEKTDFIAVDGLAPGSYFMVLKGDDSTFTGKLIVSP